MLANPFCSDIDMNQERKADIDEQLSREAVNPYLQKSHFTTVGESGTDICMSHGGRDSDATSNSELPALEDDADAKGAQVLHIPGTIYFADTCLLELASL
jgi:hypothetical protein